MVDHSGPRAFGPKRPPLWLGLTLCAVAVALATAAIYPLKSVAPAVSLSVVYLPAVLLISAYWGLLLGLVTALVSAAAFNWFHISPVGRFTISDSRNWVALAAFTIVAATVSSVAELARSRAIEAELRRQEADLAAGLARELLAGARTGEVLGEAARRVASAMELPSAAIELGSSPAEERRAALALRDPDGRQIATLLVPHDLPAETMERLRLRVVDSLGALVAIALHRDAVQAEAVETAALRRSDDVKTALLRAVSHDLRTPLTAILAAGHALGSESLPEDDRTELSAAVVDGAARLSALVDKLLDLSKLQAGRATPRPDWVSLEEVVLAAREGLGDAAAEVRVSVDFEVPDVRADAAQLERAFANLLENAGRYSGGQPVAVNIRPTASGVLVRVVDRGPGIDLEAAVRLARAENATIVPAFLARVPRNLPLDAPVPAQCSGGMPLLETIEQKATAQGLTVDSRVGRGRSYRDALRRLLEQEHFDRVIVSATDSPRIGLSGDDLEWLLERVPAEVMILRPAPDDTRQISIAANGNGGRQRASL